MEAELRHPRVSALFHGAIREALGQAYSIARIGRQDTRTWEDKQRYIVDDNGGSAAAVRFFGANSCVAAVSSHYANEVLDVEWAIGAAPPELQDALRELGELPLLMFGDEPRVTAMFWGDGERLTGPEPWPSVYKAGGDLLRSELLSDKSWSRDAEVYSLTEPVANAIILIAARAVPGQPVKMSREELELIVRSGSEHEKDALDDLTSGGVFEVSRKAL